MLKICVFIIIVNILGCFTAVLDKDAHRSSASRILKQKPLSDAGHGDGDPDYEYDHDAFLGEELSSQFEELSPEESQRRLTILLERVDQDKDGFIIQGELEVWMRKVQDEEVTEDTKTLWEEKVPPGSSYISWEQYRNRTYGFAEDGTDTYFPHGFNFTGMINRDERRFKMADRDKDNSLSEAEFKAFVHPEEVSYMKDVIVLETMDDMDADKDGKISINEYLNDLWKGPADQEPEWVTDERKQFIEQRDQDQDGYLNFSEVKEWIVPDDFDLVLAEAHHLIVTVDSDMDGKLSKDEVIDRYDVFVGSQATRYGDLLNRHDEF